MTVTIGRRELLVALGGAAAAWPLAARAQRAAIPTVGCLYPGTSAPRVAAFRKGLSETGYVEGTNVAIAVRWANNEIDRRGLCDPSGHRRGGRGQSRCVVFSRRAQIVTLAAHQGVPAICAVREFADVGGLMSYGWGVTEQYWQAGVYVGRVRETSQHSGPTGEQMRW